MAVVGEEEKVEETGQQLVHDGLDPIRSWWAKWAGGGGPGPGGVDLLVVGCWKMQVGGVGSLDWSAVEDPGRPSGWGSSMDLILQWLAPGRSPSASGSRRAVEALSMCLTCIHLLLLDFHPRSDANTQEVETPRPLGPGHHWPPLSQLPTRFLGPRAEFCFNSSGSDLLRQTPAKARLHHINTTPKAEQQVVPPSM